MYDELIRALRTCVDKDKDCLECPYCERCMNNTSGKLAAMVEAADAIEELQKQVLKWQKSRDLERSLCAVMEKQIPRWIPVTERLPEERKAVIVWEPRYLNSYICVLSEGEWYVFGGYEVKVFGVTHWMPLPEPPKEEKK